jgi:dsDNA-specific endonuclease/ATPase MutS2
MPFGDPLAPSGPVEEDLESAESPELEEALDGAFADDDEDDDGEPLPEVVEIPLEDYLDLHGFLPQDMREIVLDYVDQAWEAGFAEIRIIHGRGTGVMRENVRALLAKDPRVARFADAPMQRGGPGATLAWFRPRR